MARYTDDSRERVRDAVDFVELVGARTELKPAGPRRMTGLCPFHDERTPSFGIDPVEKLYHCFGCGAGGDVFKFAMETEGLDFAGALEVARRARGDRARARGRGSARGRAARRGASGCSRCSSAPPPTTCACCGSRPRRRPRARTSPSAGCEEDVLREFRVGFSPRAWDRVIGASRRGGLLARPSCSRPGSRRAGARDRACSTASAAGSCSRSPMPRGTCSASARARSRPTTSRSTSTRRSPSCSTRARLVYGADLARAAAARAGPARARRGLHGRDRAAPGRRSPRRSARWARR